MLDFAMLEETRQSDAVVGQMLFFSNDYDIVFSSLRIILHYLFSIFRLAQLVDSRPSLAIWQETQYSHKTDSHHPQPHHHNLLPWRPMRLIL
jgi:hypothetical protein